MEAQVLHRSADHPARQGPRAVAPDDVARAQAMPPAAAQVLVEHCDRFRFGFQRENLGARPQRHLGEPAEASAQELLKFRLVEAVAGMPALRPQLQRARPVEQQAPFHIDELHADRKIDQWRHRLRAESQPLLGATRIWFEAQLAKRPARGPTAEAIRYALNHWEGLQRFLDDGRIELDSNSIERAMRPVCLSRKNSLFAGSDEGEANRANLASLIKTCKLNGVNPQACFTDLLTRLVNGWPQNRIDELMPWHWATQGQPKNSAVPQAPWNTTYNAAACPAVHAC